MKGTVILSHGLESGPQATKVTALARVADQQGWHSVRPDYLDLDATHDPLQVSRRIERALAQTPREGRIVYGGSSMGAYTSGLASLQRTCDGLFLIALPVTIDGYPQVFDAARVPTVLVHGWRDELCPVDDAIAFARRRGDTLHLVDDTHRLTEYVEYCAEAFRQLLIAID